MWYKWYFGNHIIFLSWNVVDETKDTGFPREERMNFCESYHRLLPRGLERMCALRFHSYVLPAIQRCNCEQFSSIFPLDEVLSDVLIIDMVMIF